MCENGMNRDRCVCNLVGHHYTKRSGVWECMHCGFVNNELTTVRPAPITIQT